MNRLLPTVVRILPQGRVRGKALLLLMQATARRGGWVLARDNYGDVLLLNRAHFIDAYVLVNGSYEREHIELLLGRTADADMFLDIGANSGLFSLALARRLPVIAFEPDPDNATQLRANLALNGLCATVHEAAVSDSAGEAVLHLSRTRAEGHFGISNPGANSLEADGHSGSRNMTVPTVTLDSAALVSGKKILIKIDVEGHELAVLRGGASLLRNNYCTVLIESFSDHRAQVAALMEANGYGQSKVAGLAEHYTLWQKSAA